MKSLELDVRAEGLFRTYAEELQDNLVSLCAARDCIVSLFHNRPEMGAYSESIVPIVKTLRLLSELWSKLDME